MKSLTGHRVNVRTIRTLTDNDGMTTRHGKIIQYKTGWQVGIHGVECKTAEEVSKLLNSPICRKGNVGVWLSNGIYYVDISKRVATKNKALEMGEMMNQQSIYGWAPRKKGQLVWCE